MNISFIGMSGAGKSYVGEYIATELSLQFVDIDTQMEETYDKPLQIILEELGEDEFLKRQEQQILDLANRDGLVISPGGSVVYSEKAMKWLQANSTVVYLRVPLSVVCERISPDSRGIVGLRNSSLEELYKERSILYAEAAAHIIEVTGKTRENIATELRDILKIIW